ncbi:hypothetical protein GGE09_003932 [Roseobacter sp. N2S]|nr:hypothetical protein [Roseobacter sp. N2S]
MAICNEVLIQQIGRDVARGHAPRSPYRRAVCGSLGYSAIHETPAM